MLKIGDKLYCKKGLYWGEIDTDVEYSVLERDVDFIKVGFKDGEYGWFDIERIYNNFHTPSEVRKIKLDKLNGL